MIKGTWDALIARRAALGVEWTGWPSLATVEAGPAGEFPADDETMIWARCWLAGHHHLPAPRRDL
jgi:hypothetical protein